MQDFNQIVDTRTAIEWLMLADAAEVAGGKLYALGGGWDRLTVQSLPASKSMAVALALRVPWHETNRQHRFQIEMTDEDGNQSVSVDGATEVGRPPGIPQGQPQIVQMVINIEASFGKLGTYVIAARVNDYEERSVRFNVAAGPGVANAGQPAAGG